MSGVNKAIIVGRLGRDPELKYSQNGNAFCQLAVATSEKWRDNSGQDHERTEWHNVTAFGKQAENCAQYLTKGSQVYVEGRIQTDSYEKDGIKRYSTKIIAQSVQFLATPGGGQGGGQQRQQAAPQQRQQPQPQQGGEYEGDDIPF